MAGSYSKKTPDLLAVIISQYSMKSCSSNQYAYKNFINFTVKSLDKHGCADCTKRESNIDKNCKQYPNRLDIIFVIQTPPTKLSSGSQQRNYIFSIQLVVVIQYLELRTS